MPCYDSAMARTVLERIVDERVGQSFVGTVSVAVDRLADEFAREAMADEDFRRSIKEMVRIRSQALLARLLEQRRSRRARRRRRRS